MKKQDLKLISLVIAGNIMDYYDFLLFAHLGVVVTTCFVPDLSATDAHLLSFALFSLPFIVRPIGGYIFGKISDTQSRQLALSKTIGLASMTSFGIAMLPSYETGGIICTWIFVLLRAMQGISLGGEYTTAGTVLTERYPDRQGLMSGILSGSGTVGSLIAFCYALAYLQDYINSWRPAFLIGAVFTYINYLLRQNTKNYVIGGSIKQKFLFDISRSKAIAVTVLAGILVSLMNWLPMNYANFYLTKVLHYETSVGLSATLISIIGYIVLTPCVGYLADRYSPKKIMLVGSIIVIPAGFLCLYLIQHGNLMGQVVMIIASSIFSAPVHALMNSLFPIKLRSRFINVSFATGLSFGSMVPLISGYCVDSYGMHYVPVVILTVVSLATFCVFYHTFSWDKLES